MSAPSPPLPRTCSFKKQDGEFCKRNVPIGEGLCWQHAKSLRHKWKALSRNESIGFVLAVVSVAFGAVGLGLWWLDHHERQHVTVVEHAKPIPLENMEQLFREDFSNEAKVSSTVTVATKMPDDQTNVEGQVYIDLPAKSMFVGYYVPHSANSFDICKALIGAPKVSIDAMKRGISVKGGSLGESSKTSLDDLIFTGRVYIYSEDDFTPRQVSDLTDLFAKQQESLVLRGGDYFVSTQNARREAAAAK